MLKTKLIGILNLTPDSFSDGGDFLNPKDAIKQAQKMIKEGASVIDIGGESTRPNAPKINHKEEWQRLEEVIKLLQPLRNKIEISIDTRNPETAKKALKLGVDWINDVSGFSCTEMIEAVKNSNCKVVAMHNLGIPADKNKTISPFDDPVKIIYNWAVNKIQELTNQGIDKSRIILDPGIGFGKSSEQSLMLIQSAPSFKMLGVPIYYGHSRKSFLELMSPDAKAAQRDSDTFIVSTYLAKCEVEYLRIHNVKGNLKAIKQGLKNKKSTIKPHQHNDNCGCEH